MGAARGCPAAGENLAPETSLSRRPYAPCSSSWSLVLSSKMEQVMAFLLPSEGWHEALGVSGATQEAVSLSLVEASWEQHGYILVSSPCLPRSILVFPPCKPTSNHP